MKKIIFYVTFFFVASMSFAKGIDLSVGAGGIYNAGLDGEVSGQLSINMIPNSTRYNFSIKNEQQGAAFFQRTA